MGTHFATFGKLAASKSCYESFALLHVRTAFCFAD
jgi:hypothetical protein